MELGPSLDPQQRAPIKSDLTQAIDIAWLPAYRIISTRFPSVYLFDRVASLSEFTALYDIAALTNRRLRDEIGETSFVPDAEKLFGPGSGPIMAAFCHTNPNGSRFSNGQYGVFYAAQDEETAVAETRHHFTKFLLHSESKPGFHQMRLMTVNVVGQVDRLNEHNVDHLLDPNSYGASQAFALALRSRGSLGLVYPSVRNPGKLCLAAFRTALLRDCFHSAYYMYHFNGKEIDVVQKVIALEKF